MTDVSYREAMKHDVPPEWAERRSEGRCPVCGKDKKEFAKGLRAFCSPEHRDQYNECFVTWTEIRARVLRRDKNTCQSCGFRGSDIEWHHDPDDMKGKAQRKKLAEWLQTPKHAEVFDVLRAKALLELEELYETKFKKLMDDHCLWEDSKHDVLLHGIALTAQEEREAAPKLNVDHKVALLNGGKMWDMDNLWTLCENCHLKKTQKDFDHKKHNELVGKGRLE